MRLSLRTLTTVTLLAISAMSIGCGDDNGPTDVGPRPPSNITVSATSATSATVTWTAVPGATGYVIRRAVGATGGTFAQIATPTAATFLDAGLDPNSTYRYQVATVAGGQTSAFSSERTVTTLQAGSFATDITGDIAVNRTLYADTVYTLKGFIHVLNGATLTIQPGTKIQGDFGTLGSSLFILRGARIRAMGTQANPIVFTSSRAVGQRQPGDWGGLIIVGNARINRTAANPEIEGTGTVSDTVSGQNYAITYGGGTQDADGSGELHFVRVEFAGFGPALNQELNSFTFAAVGSATEMDHLQAIAGLDDHFEWFGGKVDATYLVSYEAGDDHFDMSEGFHGRLQHVIAFQSEVLTQRPGAGNPSSDRQGIENDGCNGSGCANGQNSTPYTIPLVANFTMVGVGDINKASSGGGFGLMLRRGTGGYYVNGVVARWPRGGVSLRDTSTYLRAGSTPTPDLATADLAIRNVLFVETPVMFEGPGTNVQNSFDLAGNSLEHNTTATTASLFVTFPAATGVNTTANDFDWSLAANSPARAGGLATFAGKLATQAAGTVTGTAYRGAAAPGGDKWWDGWTVYSQR